MRSGTRRTPRSTSSTGPPDRPGNRCDGDALFLPKARERSIAMNEEKRGTPSAVAGQQTEVAVLAGGCFWGVEEILRAVPGVLDIGSRLYGRNLDEERTEDSR